MSNAARVCDDFIKKKVIIFQFFLKNSVVRPVCDFHHLQKGETACVEPS